MTSLAAWLLAGCGVALVLIGGFFLVLRPPLTAEDVRYMGVTVEGDFVMTHRMHVYLMVGLGVAAILLFSIGTGGGWVLYVGLGVCATMMFVMTRGMGGGQRRGEKDVDNTAEQSAGQGEPPNMTPPVRNSSGLRRGGRESIESGTWWTGGRRR